MTTFCAVPVLPATLKPAIFARVPVPRSTTCSIMSVSTAAVAGDTARRTTLRGTAAREPPDTTARTTRGSTNSPPLATALTAAAICSGVTPT